MRQHRRIPLVQRTTSAPLQLVRGCRQVVGAHHLRHTAQLPQSPLHTLDQGRESLPIGKVHIPPSRMAQHEVEQQMAERLASDRHPQLAAVGEVHLRLATRGMSLLEVHLPVRPTQRTPISKTTLKRPQLRHTEPTGVSLFEPLQNRRRLQRSLNVAPQKGLDLLGPYPGERVRSSSPPSLALLLRWQPASLPRPCRPHAHPRCCGRRLLTLAFH